MSSIRMTTYRWIETDVPRDLEVRQVYGYIFNQAGNILLMNDEGKCNLPGGGPESGESFAETLIRETAEEIQVTITSLEYLGYQLITDTEEYAQVRLVCQLDQISPSKADPSTGRIYSRFWMPPIDANELLEWGESGDQQIESAIKRASKWGVS